MRLAIVRHGKAEDRSGTGQDRDRELRPKGERQAKFLGERFAASPWKPALIIASPYPRALATARIIGELVAAPIQEAAELTCDQPVSSALSLLGDGAEAPLMLVGHNPQLSHVVSALLHGLGGPPHALRTGEAALLDLEPDRPIGGKSRLEAIWRLPEH